MLGIILDAPFEVLALVSGAGSASRGGPECRDAAAGEPDGLPFAAATPAGAGTERGELPGCCSGAEVGIGFVRRGSRFP